MKKKYIWFIEIFVWLFVISLSLYLFIYNNAIKNNVQNSYYIFFDDVAGLVQGSPVRLAGMNIGHVKDIKIFDNKVFVSFLVTKENLKIPNKASATIEFYGLGGSTSLELSTETCENDDENIIMPVETYKIQDYWDGQALVSNVMIDIYGGVGRTLGKAETIQYKKLLKQSKLVKEFNNLTGNVNTAQSVVIYKLSDSTNEYINKKINKALENEVLKNAN